MKILDYRERKRRKSYTEGVKFHRAGDLVRALECYQAMLDRNPRDPAALHQAAIVARQLSAVRKARGKPPIDDVVMRFMALAVTEAPDNAAAVHNFAKFHHDLGNLDEARELYLNALRLNPKQAESWVNLGNVLMDLGEREDGEEAWNQACVIPAADGDAKFNRSFLKLSRGDYAAGWEEYEHRWKAPEFLHGYGREDLRAPRWNGGLFTGSVLLHGEQGAGDMLMMARYVPLARARGGRVLLEVYDSLVELFQRAFPDVEVFARGDRLPPFTMQLPMMSLPWACDTRALADVPAPTPFLPWRPKARGERHVGVVWAGSPTHPNDRSRSLTPEAAAALVAPLAGVRFRSLQLGARQHELAGLVPPDVRDFHDTAILLSKLDAVITVDTSIAHLAGSIGIPTWILVPVHAEWRWLQDRDDSPWYPSARLVRQTTAGDWLDVVARAREQLELLAGRRAA